MKTDWMEWVCCGPIIMLFYAGLALIWTVMAVAIALAAIAAGGLAWKAILATIGIFW